MIGGRDRRAPPALKKNLNGMKIIYLTLSLTSFLYLSHTSFISSPFNPYTSLQCMEKRERVCDRGEVGFWEVKKRGTEGREGDRREV